MRNSVVQVVCYVRGSDMVVKVVNNEGIRPVDGAQSPLQEAVRVLAKVWNVGVRVLQPRVKDKPKSKSGS